MSKLCSLFENVLIGFIKVEGCFLGVVALSGGLGTAERPSDIESNG